MLNKIIYLIFLLTFSSGFDYKKEIEDITSVNKVIISKDIEEKKSIYPQKIWFFARKLLPLHRD